MRRSWTRGVGGGQWTGWVWPCSCARCRGWGSSRMRSAGRRRWRFRGWLAGWGSIRVCWPGTASGSRPVPTGGMVIKELEQFLIGRAMEHDSPSTLFNLACEYLIATRTVRPGVVTLTQMVATARTTATVLTYEKVAHLLTRQLTA